MNANPWLRHIERASFDYDHGRRHLGYMNHYYRCANGGHNQAVLAFLAPSRADGRGLWLGDLTRYRQVLDLYAMALTTEWAVGEATYRTRSFASMALPELFATEFSCALPAPGDAIPGLGRVRDGRPHES